MILLGPPGAGKGTQADFIGQKLNIPAISTGNIIREAVKAGTPAGIAAKPLIEAGKLVSNELVVQLLNEKIAQDDCKSGYILDGFPRTVEQAQELDRMGVVIDKVIEISVSDEVITKRLAGRRVCNSCGTTFHIEYKLSDKGDICEKCGGNLVLRKDDEPATVLERLKIYHELTEPLKDYYNAVGKLYVVEGQEKVQSTTELVFAALDY